MLFQIWFQVPQGIVINLVLHLVPVITLMVLFKMDGDRITGPSMQHLIEARQLKLVVRNLHYQLLTKHPLELLYLMAKHGTIAKQCIRLQIMNRMLVTEAV